MVSQEIRFLSAAEGPRMELTRASRTSRAAWRLASSIVKLLTTSTHVLISSDAGRRTRNQSFVRLFVRGSKLGRPLRTMYALLKEMKIITIPVNATDIPNRARLTRISKLLDAA